jgi:hypothetical protein
MMWSDRHCREGKGRKDEMAMHWEEMNENQIENSRSWA